MVMIITIFRKQIFLIQKDIKQKAVFYSNNINHFIELFIIFSYNYIYID